MVSINAINVVLLYAIALCGAVPLFPWLESAPRAALLLGAAAGVWQDRRGVWRLKTWMLNSAIVPVFIWYALRFSVANPVQPVVSALSVMLAVRLGEKNARHGLQIQALSLFCLASSSLFDLGPAFLVWLTLLLLAAAVSLVLLAFQGEEERLMIGRADLRRVLAVALLLPLASLPLLMVFFPLLPRTQLPLWNMTAATVARVSGYADRVETGSAAAVTESGTPVFRAEMPRVPKSQLYWRCTVFNRIEGQRWLRGVPADERPAAAGERVGQVIFPESSLRRALPALDAPLAVSGLPVRRAPDGVLEADGSGTRHSYQAESALSGTIRTERAIDRGFYLELPEGLAPRMAALAGQIRRQGGGDRQRLELLERQFRNGGYRYSRSGLPTGDRALERFLFETREGHCEFFASSFAHLLRGAGVPARLVGGYLGGDYNELGRYYLVSERMAHVWVEAWLEGSGWVRIDPSSFAVNAGTALAERGRKDPLVSLRLLMDTLDHLWNRAVITYDFQRQMEAAAGIGRLAQEVRPAALTGRLGGIAAGLACLVLLAVAWVRRAVLFPPRDLRLLRRFCRRVRRDCGVEPDLERRGLLGLADELPLPAIREFAEIYAAALYHDRRLTDGEYERLVQLCRRGFRQAGCGMRESLGRRQPQQQ